MPVIIDLSTSGPPTKSGDTAAATWHARLDAWVRRSPPFTVSLSLHIVALLALALWVVRSQRPERVVIDLSFASLEVVEAPVQGVPIVAPKPVEEPEPEEVKSEEPPVEEPISAPPPVAPEAIDEPGPAVAAAAPAVAVGTLLEGRREGRREALVNAFGGSDATEAAVARALDWLARQQDRKDGLWNLRGPYLDGTSAQENRLAATAMALLAFQGAGNTTDAGRHKEVVRRAWKALVSRQLPDGRFEVFPPIPTHHALYSHGQVTIAACELFGMTHDATHRDPAARALAYALNAQGANGGWRAEPAERALAYCLAAQGPNGGWRYEPGKDGDMSVTGWYMMALKSAQMAGLDVPAAALAGIGSFVEEVSVEGGTKYGYRRDSPQRPPAQVTAAVTAEGLLCRQYLGWQQRDRRLMAGLELLLGSKFIDWENDKDVYAWYYITQVAHHAGGEPWDRWNARMKSVLPAAQVQKGPEAGSWDPSLDKWGHIGGRLFVTCFCTYMLEVYYRHLPLYDDKALQSAVAAPAP
jgi:hypothetical protein